MKRNIWKKTMAFLLMFTIVLAGGCGGSPTEAIDEGAEEFAEGKSETEYAFQTTDDVLNKLMADFSGSFGQPGGQEMGEEESKKIVDNTRDEDKVDTTGTDQIVHTDEDLKEVIHGMFIDTKTYAVFETASNYSFDGDKVIEICDRLLFEDGYDVMCLDYVSWRQTGTKAELYFYYFYDVETLKAMKEEQRALVSQAKNEVEALLGSSSASDYEIVKAVNEYLCDKVVYPENDMVKYSTYGGFAPDSHTAYSALKKGSAVCDGYSKAAKLILNEFGVDCGIEVGPCHDGGLHAWNLANVDDSWYQLDVTWNDCSGDYYDHSWRSYYTLVTDAFMKESRSWEESWYPKTPSKPYK